MATAPIPELRSTEKPPFWRDVRNLRWGGQLIVVALVLGFVFWLYDNATTNIAASGRSASFDFLSFDFRSAIPGIEGAADLTVFEAFVVGYQNVIRVIAFGIPACTVLGILVGVARLSDNALVRAVGTLYVETFRNVPPLLWVFFGVQVFLIEGLPPIAEVASRRIEEPGGGLFDFVIAHNNGVIIPWLNPAASRWGFLALLLVGAAVTFAVVKWRGAVNARTGDPARGGLWGTATFLVMVVVAHLGSGGALALEAPTIFVQDNGIPLIEGGLTAQRAYVGLTIALTLYTASHVAEIVRGAIQAIHKGQAEAANAIALTTYQRYRFVILPQAFRIMIPPLASQYLNITKNTSLGVLVSYIELAAIFQRVTNNAAPALYALIVMMGFYLTFSLGISFIANVVNRRLALETR